MLIGGTVGEIISFQRSNLFDYTFMYLGIVWFGLLLGFYYLEIKQRSIKYKIVLALCISLLPIALDYNGLYDAIIFAVLYITPMPIAHFLYGLRKSKQRSSE